MNTTSTIALPASSSLPAVSLVARLAHALRSLRLCFSTPATEPHFMDLEPKDLVHEHLPEHPADRIRRENMDRALAACQHLR